MELGVLNKIDRELNNSSKKNSDQNYDHNSGHISRKWSEIQN